MANTSPPGIAGALRIVMLQGRKLDSGNPAASVLDVPAGRPHPWGWSGRMSPRSLQDRLDTLPERHPIRPGGPRDPQPVPTKAIQSISRGPETHGSTSHRAPGSIGTSATPSRVIKGRKMPGQHGDRRVTTKNLTVIDVRPEQNLIVLKGAVPGARNGLVVLTKSDYR